MTGTKSKPRTGAKTTTVNATSAAKNPPAGAVTSGSPSSADAVPGGQATAAQQSGKPAKKEKRVRSSFSMPESQFALIAELKATCAAFGLAPKKSELLVAGLRALKKLSETALEAEVLPALRTGRRGAKGKPPKK